MTAYYNEIDPYAAQWLRNLIDAGHIAPGIVDERSIEDVRPVDLHGFTQCHFFAGIGVWSLALRRAGWADDHPIWTASCPCQPFSQAGEGDGFADERHLWPHLHHLITQCAPPIIVGEQVASKDADPWIDLVQADMEALDYAFGAVAFPSAGVGAPHIRDRTYWVADICSEGLAQRERLVRISCGAIGTDPRQTSERNGVCNADRLVHAHGGNTGAERQQCGGQQRQQPKDGGRLRMAPGATFDADTRAGPTNGLWRNADWLNCRDGRWRPVEPGTFPLAHGAASRVGRLRAYGNAVNAEAARVWIETVMDCLLV